MTEQTETAAEPDRGETAPTETDPRDRADWGDLPEPARRALIEAYERRRAAAPLKLPPELGGRNGPEPVRYGDYEKKGLAVEF